MEWWKGAYNGWNGGRGVTTDGLMEGRLQRMKCVEREVTTDAMCRRDITTDAMCGKEITTDGMC